MSEFVGGDADREGNMNEQTRIAATTNRISSSKQSAHTKEPSSSEHDREQQHNTGRNAGGRSNTMSHDDHSNRVRECVVITDNTSCVSAIAFARNDSYRLD